MAPDPTKPNQLQVYFPTNPRPGKYDVWKTDYNTYTLIYRFEKKFYLFYCQISFFNKIKNNCLLIKL